MKIAAILITLICPIFSGYAAERYVTLTWDKSIDDAYIQYYRVYYYRISQDINSLTPADYAVSYILYGGSTFTIAPTDPKPVTIPKESNQITFRFADASKDYFFAVTAVDPRGLESTPSPERSPISMPSEIKFGYVPVGSTSDRQVSITNTLGSTITGTAYTTGPFSIVSGGSYSIEPGQSHDVTIRYTPTSGGLQTGTASFSGWGGATVQLSGGNRYPSMPWLMMLLFE